MDTSYLTVIIPLFISLIVAIGGIVAARASASGVITDAALKLIAPLKKQINDLEKKVDLQEAEIKKLRRGTEVLIKQICRLGHKPDWTPEKDT
jgi:cell division protein FtsB